jgi:ABC-2 type transport system ATP-binding protein
VSILENFNPINRYDAYYIKPYIGYLTQEFTNVWMDLSCYYNVYFSLVLRWYNQGKEIPKYHIIKSEVERILIDMNLNNVHDRLAKHLSGGMLRRLGMCNAVAGDSKIIILDEVTAGVDPVIKRKIWKCIEQISQVKKSTIIMSTHDTSEIAEMA